MSFDRGPAQLADLPHHARLLIEQMDAQQERLEAFTASAERDVQQAKATLAVATDADPAEVCELLSVQTQRSAAGAASARRICVGAREQQLAARQLLASLNRSQRANEQCAHAVLVVDDYEEIREVLAHLLQEAGSSSERQPMGSRV